MKRRSKMLMAVAFMLLATILAFVVRHYQLRAATEAYFAQLRAQGEPMDLAKALPPPLSPEENAARFITNALTEIWSERIYTNSLTINNPPNEMDRTIPGKRLIGWEQPYVHDPTGSYPTNTWDELGAQLIERQNDLNDLRKLIKNPTIDFSYNYSDLYGNGAGLAPHLEELKCAADWMAASELYNLHYGKTAKSCDDVRTMLALANSFARDRFNFSQCVRFGIASKAANATWDILQATNISDKDLAQLQQDWQSLALFKSVEHAYLMERVLQIRLQEQYRENPNAVWEYVMPANPVPNFLYEMQWLWFWSYTDEKEAAQIYQININSVRMAETNASFLEIASFAKSQLPSFYYDVTRESGGMHLDLIAPEMRSVLSEDAYDSFLVLRRAMGCAAIKNIVISAIALKRYEIRHNQLPDTLADLVPDLLPSVPLDPMDGRPLRYRPNKDSTFLLYSIGENGKDDGGNAALKKSPGSDDEGPGDYYWLSSDALDWVWPQTATPEDIQDYYAHLVSR